MFPDFNWMDFELVDLDDRGLAYCYNHERPTSPIENPSHPVRYGKIPSTATSGWIENTRKLHNYWDTQFIAGSAASRTSECTVSVLRYGDEVIAMAFEYIDVSYNRKRLHSTLCYKSPMRFLSDWLTAQQQEKLEA